MNNSKTFQVANAQYRPFWEGYLSHLRTNLYSTKIVAEEYFQTEHGKVKEKCVGFYDNELLRGDAMYVELVNFAKDILDPDVRTLYRWVPHRNFASLPQLYTSKTFTGKGGEQKTMWYVRITDLEEVNTTHASYGSAVFHSNGKNLVGTVTNMGSGGSNPIPAASFIPEPQPVAQTVMQEPARFGFPPSTPTIPAPAHTPAPAAVLTEDPGLRAPLLPANEEASLHEDDHLTKKTMRDECAILWRKPVSHKPWLNQLINETFPQQ